MALVRLELVSIVERESSADSAKTVAFEATGTSPISDQAAGADVKELLSSCRI